jgi:hypothetical protein
MNWKFWQKKQDPEFFIDTSDIPASTLLRWALYDTGIPDPNKYALALGFNPISKEGEEMELRESLLRMARLDPYIDFIELVSSINGEILAETFSSILEKLDIDVSDKDLVEGREMLSELYAGIALSCIVPAFSAALHLGILVNPGAYVVEADNEF